MTAQIKERIIINGKEYYMYSEPLKPYLKEPHEKIKFDYRTTACWRGYVGTWQLVKNKLFLIDFLGNKFNTDSNVFNEVGMDYLFPDEDEVHADWFTGEIIIPDGEILFHGAYNHLPSYENYLILHFNKGILVDFKSENTLEQMVNEIQIKQSLIYLNFWDRIRTWIFK